MVVASTMSKRRLLVKFGREIRKRREALKLPREQLAERAGLTANYIGTIELGLRDPSITTIVAIARGLGIAPGDLFSPPPPLPPAAIAMGKLFDAAAPGVRDAALTILREVLALGLADVSPKPPRGSG